MKNLALALSVLVASSGLAAAAEYYFVSDTNSKYLVWSSSGECRGSGCAPLGMCANGVTYHTYAAALSVAGRMYNDGQSIQLRENWSPFNVICTWRPPRRLE